MNPGQQDYPNYHNNEHSSTIYANHKNFLIENISCLVNRTTLQCEGAMIEHVLHTMQTMPRWPTSSMRTAIIAVQFTCCAHSAVVTTVLPPRQY